MPDSIDVPCARGLDELKFDNRFTAQLPADTVTTNSRRQVYEACYSRVLPTRVKQPKLISYSQEVADLLGLSSSACETRRFAEVFAGNALLSGMDPFAMCYGGHQFGNWAGQLGDGRAINLGEVINHNREHWMLQLKGAGPTPYSRTADGLAVLRSSVREYLCSESMHHLGVPTTRALSLILTGESVMRDMFYDGNAALEPGAVVCRVAPSFTRFGNFQIFSARKDIDNLRRFVDYTIRSDFPHLGDPSPEVYLEWFDEICRRTADMIVHWMRVGFVHGVMNTDNMSILGLTIDYGPYGWVEDFDPGWTPNTTDATGRRYRFANQPAVAHWNLYQLANSLVPLFEEVTPLESALERFREYYESGYRDMMAAKLGLEPDVAAACDDLSTEALTNDLLQILELVETDMTIFYRRLADLRVLASDVETINADVDNSKIVEPLLDAYYQPEQLSDENVDQIARWVRRYRKRVLSDGFPDEIRKRKMDSVNPKYVLRNYMAQLAIDKSTNGDHSLVRELLDVLRHPYDEQPESEKHAEKRPDWARTRAGCSMLSCSS